MRPGTLDYLLKERPNLRRKSIGIGVVGYGYWGPNLVRNFASTEKSRVVAICDRDATKLAVSKRLHPDVVITKRIYGSAERWPDRRHRNRNSC